MASRILDSTSTREQLSFIEMGKTVAIEGLAEKIQTPIGFFRRDWRQLDA